MCNIVIIRDEMHPLLAKIEERIQELGCKAEIVYWKNITSYNFEGVQIIYMDRMGEKYPTYETQIWLLFDIAKKAGIRIINDVHKYIIARNKILTALYLKEKGINIPNTTVVTQLEQIKKLKHKKLVCKPYLGACADGVIPFWANNIPNDVKRLLDTDGMIVVQEFIYNPERYIWRVDIVDGEIVQLNQRFSFNSNIEFPVCNGTHGGEIVIWNPKKIPHELKELVDSVYKLMGLIVLGIDILVNEAGDLYLLEVNPEPDITQDFVGFPYKIAEYLVKESKEKRNENINSFNNWSD